MPEKLTLNTKHNDDFKKSGASSSLVLNSRVDQIPNKVDIPQKY